MVIQLSAELKAILTAMAQKRGISPDQLIAETLMAHLTPQNHSLVPQDEWERRLFSIATPCGVSLTDESCSSEGIYD
jgi:hypothetical protein